MNRPVRVLHVRSEAGDVYSGADADPEVDADPTPHRSPPDPAWADDRVAVDRVGSDVAGLDADEVAASDCVVVDDAPGVDPLGVCRAVRGVAPDTPVVVATPPDRPRVDETLVVGADRPDVDPDDALDLATLVVAVAGRGTGDGDGANGGDSGEGGGPVDSATIRALHDVAGDLVECESDTEAFQRAVAAANDLLEFDQSVVYEREGDRLVPAVATSDSGVLPREEVATFGVDEGAIGHVYQTGESVVVDDVRTSDVAEPTSPTIRSGIAVPLGEIGVFNAISDRRGAFDDEDLAMAEILAAHVTTVVERIRSEARTRGERNRFVALFETVPDAVVVTEPAGNDPRIRAVNQAFEETFGVDGDAVEGDRFRDHVGLPSGEERVDVPEDGYRVAEIRRETPDGVRDFLFRGFAAELGDDRQHVAIFTDITERNARKRELERKTQRLEEFASIVSHDLRNPLSVAGGWLEVIDADEHREEAVREIESALARMESLIDDLLALSRQGWTVDDADPVDGRRVVDRAWGNVSTGDATVECEWDGTVRADEDRLVEVFENLFRNSVEHGSTGDRDGGSGDTGVTVRVEPLPDAPGVYVADDGPGIDPGVGDSLFELGVSGGGGTGLGLGIVRRIVEAHGWTIAADESEDGGARFEIRFEDAEADDPGDRTDGSHHTDQV